MECVKTENAIGNLQYNKIIGKLKLSDSVINFHGVGNLVFVRDVPNQIAFFNKSIISFFGDNNLIFIDPGKAVYTINCNLYHNSVLAIGANNYFNPYGEIVKFRCAEEKNIFIGDECMFADNVNVWTSDAHLIFDGNSFTRMNYAKSVYIGDHVWIGSKSTILKGVKIGSGSIVGANSTITGKKIFSNSCWGGMPCKVLNRNIFWVGYNALPYKSTDIEKHSKYNSERYIFYNENTNMDFMQIETKLTQAKLVDKKLQFLINLVEQKTKNRFYISEV